MATTRGKWEVNVGDQVWVHSNGSRRWDLAVVEKVGTKLVHVRESKFRTTAFILETGARRDGYSGGFQTLAQRVDGELRFEMMKTLRDVYGVEVGTYNRTDWDTDALERLLSFVRTVIDKTPPEESKD